MGHSRPATPAAAALQGRRSHLAAVEVERRSVVGDGLARPQRRDELERLVEQRGPRAPVALLAEAGQLAAAVAAQARAEDHPAAREPVEDGDLARDVPRPAARQRRDEGAQAHPLGPSRRHGERQPRVRDVEAGVGHRVVPDEDAVPARRLRARGDLAHQADVGQLPERREVQPAAQRQAATASSPTGHTRRTS